MHCERSSKLLPMCEIRWIRRSERSEPRWILPRRNSSNPSKRLKNYLPCTKSPLNKRELRCGLYPPGPGHASYPIGLPPACSCARSACWSSASPVAPKIPQPPRVSTRSRSCVNLSAMSRQKFDERLQNLLARSATHEPWSLFSPSCTILQRWSAKPQYSPWDA